MLKQKNWSPYMSGVIIGLLQIPLVLFVGHTLGMSSSFSTLVSMLSDWLGGCCSQAPSTHLWQIGTAFGLVLGTYLSAKLSKTQRPRISSVWNVEFGLKSIKLRYVLSFLGGALMALGARLAKGCTSGNGISGASQLDVNAWVALMSMFSAAILFAFFMKLISKHKG